MPYAVTTIFFRALPAKAGKGSHDKTVDFNPIAG